MDSLQSQAKELRRYLFDLFHKVRMVEASRSALPHAELNLHELRVLRFLGDNGPAMMRELAERLMVAVNSVTPIVDHLEKKKLVRRVRSASDRRVIHVELTKQGQLTWDTALAEQVRFCATMLEALNDEERDAHMDLMRKIARAALVEDEPLVGRGKRRAA